jgi:hypothetical protein
VQAAAVTEPEAPARSEARQLGGTRSLACGAAQLTPTLDPTAQPVGVDDLGMDL